MTDIRPAGSRTVAPDSDEAKRIESTHGFGKMGADAGSADAGKAAKTPKAKTSEGKK